MICPKCGYAMGPFDVECERCKRLGEPAQPAAKPGLPSPFDLSHEQLRQLDDAHEGAPQEPALKPGRTLPLEALPTAADVKQTAPAATGWMRGLKDKDAWNSLSPAERKQAMKALAVFVVVIGTVFGIIFGWFGGTGEPSDIEIASWAQVAVLDHLKCPSTARFLMDDTILPTGTPGEYKVMGHVDSQNSFGAMLRSSYAVTLHKAGVDHWVATSVDIH
jgi:hypothetical protein